MDILVDPSMLDIVTLVIRHAKVTHSSKFKPNGSPVLKIGISIYKKKKHVMQIDRDAIAWRLLTT